MNKFQENDRRFIWHPFTQMQTAKLPFVITRGNGAILYSGDGREFIDAISSWWVNLHGHCNTEIAAAISAQVNILDQVIFAGFTHPVAVSFAEELIGALNLDGNFHMNGGDHWGNQSYSDEPNFQKIFFSDNGSTTIEVALKMAIQYWNNQGLKKNKIIALEHSYHGDTFGSMSVSERGAFTLPFHDMLFEVYFLPSPAIDAEKTIIELQKILAENPDSIAAMIYEPLVQGAGGMLMYGPNVLEQMIHLCRANNVLAIADEVMTGFGRTGKLFASHYASQLPDIICLSKGITGGFLPLGVTACSDEIYNAFLSSDKMKTFFHGHSYTANAVSLAAARTSLKLLKKCQPQVESIHHQHLGFIERLNKISCVEKIRVRGTILAFDVTTTESSSYFHSLRDNLFENFLDSGILLRPLGNTVYILPPYCIKQEELSRVYDVIEKVIKQVN